jgi:SAM-dependent methyltransferase
MRLSDDKLHSLNAVCPYFTMFPLEFPLSVLARRARDARLILDPFCGRGTTLYAARHRGVRAIGIDCSPIAVAISRAKLVGVSVDGPLDLARRILAEHDHVETPTSDFFRLAFDADTLRDICRLRAGLLKAVDTDETVLLRAVLLGVLHGPRTTTQSYLSNQMQRTFSAKPDYAVRYWRARGLEPPKVNVLAAIERKLKRIAQGRYARIRRGWRDVLCGDASTQAVFRRVPVGIDAVITSPPYYGMRTYVADQWLRNWFLGGPPHVDYSDPGDLPSSSPDDFAAALGRTWRNAAARGSDRFRLFVRFGAIPSRAVNARELLLASLEASRITWRIVSVRNAQTADAGKRQVGQMRTYGAPAEEFDLHAMPA